MFASRVGADCVFACDLSETMCDIAAKALQANGMSDRVTLYHMMSTDMKIPKHLPERSMWYTELTDRQTDPDRQTDIDPDRTHPW